MITKFKIFENHEEKKFYYASIEPEDIIKVDNRLKKNKISYGWFYSKDDDEKELLVVVANMTNKQKSNFKKGIFWNDHEKTALYLMIKFNSIVDVNEFFENWKLKNAIKIYNI